MQAKEAKAFARNEILEGVITIAPEASVTEATALMRDANIHHLLVMRGEECLGVLDARDLLGEPNEATEVHEVMRRDVLLIDEETDIRTAVSYMVEYGVTALPLTRKGRVTGILTESDLLSLLERFVDGRTRVKDVLARGESVVAHPLVQKLAQALGDAGI